MHINFQTFITKQKIDGFYSEHPVVVIFKLSHCVFQYISNKMQLYTVYLYLETALHLLGWYLHQSSGAHKLCKVASCWIYIGIHLRCMDPQTLHLLHCD